MEIILLRSVFCSGEGDAYEREMKEKKSPPRQKGGEEDVGEIIDKDMKEKE